MHARTSHYSNRGFTIVELLIVVVVIAILATITIVAYTGIQTRARDDLVKSDLNAVEKKIGIYSVQNNETLGSGVVWYSESGTNSNIQFKPSGDTIIDVVANSTLYCIRAYNPNSGSYKTILNAATKGSTPDSCTTLPPSDQALGVVYSQSFDTDLDGWSGTAIIERDATRYASAPAALCITRTGNGFTMYAEKVLTGLTVGSSYTANAKLMRTGSSVTNASLKIKEIGGTATFAGALDTWTAVSYPFTATSTSHTIQLYAAYINSVYFCIDDVQVVKS